MYFARLISAVVAICFLAQPAVFANETPTDESLSLGDSQRYKRIISAGGSITEILHAIGVFDQVIAVDSSSLYPAKAHALPKIGYFRTIGAEGVLALEPDLLVAARGAGPDTALDQIRAAGVPVVQFEQSIYTTESWSELVHSIGRYFDKTQQAANLIETALTDIAEVQQNRKYKSQVLNAIALLNAGQRGPIAAGKNTMPDLLLSLAGINNVAIDLEGYKPFSTEVLAQSELDLILVPHHTIESMGGPDAVCKIPAIQFATKKGCNVQVMNGLLLLGFGARIHQAVAEVANLGNKTLEVK